MVRGNVDVPHKSRAYLCVQGSSIAQVFPVFLITPCIPTTHLFHLLRTFVGVCDGEASGTIYTLRS